jgi:cardiolipin synthase
MLKNDEFKKNNSVKLIKSAEYFPLLISCIKSARQTIYFHTYIFSNDPTGKMVATELMASSQKGVKIYLLIDGFASRQLPIEIINKFRKAGINVAHFEPILKSKSYYFGRRMHQKVIVADEDKAIIGGINIADKYNNTSKHKAWLDFAVEVNGEVVQEITAYCKEFWKTEVRNIENEGCFFNQNKEIKKEAEKKENCLARVRINDWLKHRNEVSNTYLQLFKNAQKEIYILCSYFLPGRAIRRQMAKSAKKGIAIKVIMAGKSDVAIAKYAERWLYDWLLRNHIQLYEFQPNVLHGKIAVSDESLVTIGSYNINNISTYASLEMNIDIKDDGFAKKVKDEMEKIITSDCISITTELHKKRKNSLKQFSRWLSYQTIRFLFFLFTFYFKRKNINYHKSA